MPRKKTKHEREHPPKWNPGNSERGKIVGTAKHGKGHSAPRSGSKTPTKQHAGRTLKSTARWRPATQPLNAVTPATQSAKCLAPGRFGSSRLDFLQHLYGAFQHWRVTNLRSHHDLDAAILLVAEFFVQTRTVRERCAVRDHKRRINAALLDQLQ